MKNTPTIRPATAIRLGLALGLGCSVAILSPPLPAQPAPAPKGSPAVEAWLDGRDTTGWPKITYSGPPIQMRFTSGIPRTSTMVPVWDRGVPLLEKMTNGKIVVSQFHTGTVHGANDGFKAVRDNLSDFAVCYVLFERRGFALSKVFSIPYTNPDDPAVASRVYTELAAKYFRKEFESAGVLYGHTTQFGHNNLISKKPVRRLEDVRGLKVASSGADTDLMRQLGAAPIVVPPFDRYTALQTGVVDATTFTDVAILSLRLFEVAKFHTAVGTGSTQIDHCIRPDWYKALPADLKEAFRIWNQAMAMAEVDIAVLEPKQRLEALFKAQSVETIRLDAGQLKAWKDAAKPVVDKWVEEAKKENLPVDAMLADLQALVKKYSGKSANDLMLLTLKEPVKGLID